MTVSSFGEAANFDSKLLRYARAIFYWNNGEGSDKMYEN